MISGMNLEELKRYLRLRVLRVTGRKQELVARAFSAVENEVQPVKPATEIGFEYSYKLKLDDAVIADPYAVTDGWISMARNNGRSAVKYRLLIDSYRPQIVIGGLNDRRLLISNRILFS